MARSVRISDGVGSPELMERNETADWPWKGTPEGVGPSRELTCSQAQRHKRSGSGQRAVVPILLQCGHELVGYVGVDLLSRGRLSFGVASGVQERIDVALLGVVPLAALEVGAWDRTSLVGHHATSGSLASASTQFAPGLFL